MQREFNRPHSLFLRTLIAVLAAIWVWEFLPVMEQLHLLVAAPTFLFVFLVLAVVQLLPGLIFRLVGGLVASVVYVWYYFRPLNASTGEGIHLVFSAFWHDVILLWQNYNLVDPLQTWLFILALCGIYWLVIYAAARKRLWLFYNGLAVLVLSLVDGNTPVHPTQALIVDVVIFLFVLGLNQYHSLGEAMVLKKRNTALRFFVPLTGVIVVSFIVAGLLPKQQAVWANPFQGRAQSSGGGGAGSSRLVIGYQSNNAHLGGSFVMNYSPVLSVITKYPTYLRGQSYSDYTGKGWTQGPVSSQFVPPNQSFSLQGTAAYQNLPSQEVSQKITVLASQNYKVLFGAYSINKLMSGLNGQNQPVQVNTQNGNVSALSNLRQNETYTVDSRELEDPKNTLSKLQGSETYPPDIQQTYLELPRSLPSNIRSLTDKVTAGDTTEYGKVISVLNFLQNNFTYSTQGIPVPGPGQDYVEQFLFQTQKGYCNNFSSAMAVMLRTVNVPTRWVTGFTYGQQDFNYTGPGEKFIIRNADAHSWVEVYFPNVGWVPFDPTPNFTMTFAPTPAGQTPSTPSTPPTPTPKQPPVKTPPAASAGGTTNVFGTLASLWSFGKWIVVGLLLIVGMAALASRKRIYQARLWSGMTPNAMGRAVAYLLRLLAKVRGLPNPSPTLRDLTTVAREYGVHEQDYRDFVITAEKAWYAGETVNHEEFENAKRTWGGFVSKLYQQRRDNRRRRRSGKRS